MVRLSLSAALALALLSCSTGNEPVKEVAHAGEEEHNADRVELSPAVLKATNIETVEAEERNATASIAVTGTVEANQQKIQQATPLVSGRVERVNAILGDRVQQGAILAVIASPEVAEMHGKLHEAETRLNLAEQALERVQRAENRAGVIQSKARLDEADANLRRTRRLIELGAAAGKDLTAAETAQSSAKAEYDFQNNISVNREVQEARSEVEITRVEVAHLRNSLTALGASMAETSSPAPHDTSTVILRSPIQGTITDRLINAGAGIEAGKPVFTIVDLATLWVIANVPEGRISALRLGTPTEIHAPELGTQAIAGRVAYIDPILNEETRTGRVRIEIANPRERLKIGAFVEVRFQTSTTGTNESAVQTVVIPDEAVQRIAERTIVFVPDDKPGEYAVRDIELGDAMGGLHEVRSGLKAGERVVTKGSFILKTQLLKGELGEH